MNNKNDYQLEIQKGDEKSSTNVNESEETEQISENDKSCKTEEYLCDTCDVVFTHMDKFFNHATQEHNLQKDNISYDCAKCYRSFKNTLLFKNHIHEDRKCEFCDSSFSTSTLLNQHINLMHEVRKNDKCDSCSNSYLHKRGLKNHIQTVMKAPK